jgi:hypothetical protein
MSDQWLFRQQDLILGPVTAEQIVQKLYAGELTPQSEVQQMGDGQFKAISEIAQFKVHVAKSAAKARVEAHEVTTASKNRNRVLKLLGIGAGIVTALALVLALAGNYMAIHAPTGKSAEELAWGDITIDTPTISAARRSTNDDELVDYQTGTKKPIAKPNVNNTNTNAANPNTATPTAPIAGKTKPSNDPDGMEMGQVDENAINSVVAKNKPTLIPCIKAVAKPGVFAKIPIEFTVAETGKVSKVWVDNPDFKGTGLDECLLKELSKWPFPAGSSGASVNLSFNIGKKP